MQNYSTIQKFLHDFVFSRKFVNKSLFELEKVIYLKNIEIKSQSHIFITGLPRSGTTSLLNFIYSSSQYASLTYKNMPFVLSPNFSKLFHKKILQKKKECTEMVSIMTLIVLKHLMKYFLIIMKNL